MASLLSSSEWLAKAEQARRLADTMHDPHSHQTLMTIAAEYEKLARRAALMERETPSVDE